MIEHTIDIPIDVPLLPYKVVSAGDLTMIYEAGNLRYIKCGDIELIRMIYGAVRDENWETIIPTITDEVWRESEDSISIHYTALYTREDLQYQGEFAIDIDRNNSITISMKGTALNSFKKNRIGLCVLHPLIECKGKKATIEKPTGEVYEAAFPGLVSPHQPFKDIRNMQWEAAEGLQVHLAFEGDIFETEDQRNWGDSSYKTYSTPLDLPLPVLVNQDETILQQVTLTVTGNTKPKIEKTPSIKSLDNTIVLPAIGYCRPANMLSGEPTNQLQKKAIHHWRVELRLDDMYWQNELMKVAEEATMLKTKLELILFFSENNEQQLQLFVQQLKLVAPNVYSILLLHKDDNTTPGKLMQQGYEIIKAAHPFIKVGYGTDGFFAELNRNRPGCLPHDFVSFSLTPMVHTRDTRSIIENLDCQPDIIKTIRSFTDKEIHISPLTIKMRSGIHATNVPGYLDINGDWLSNTNFTAAWIAFAIQELSGVNSITIALTSFITNPA